MKQALLTIIVVFVGLAKCQTQSDYCSYCPNHALCKPLPSVCGPDALLKKLTQAEIDVVVKAHNHWRDQYASGKTDTIQKTKFSTISDMNALTWDLQLATMADANVNQCQMKHDPCLLKAKKASAGQNLYWSASGDGYPTVSSALENAVKAWFDESKDASQADVNVFRGGAESGKVIGHFTQVIWSKATKVGCGVKFYRQSAWYAVLVACDYSDGNMVTIPCGKVGPPGASCKTKHSEFKSLCATI